MRVLRKCLIAALIVALTVAVTVPAMARKEARMELKIGDVIVGDSIILQRPAQVLFHKQDLARSDTEALAVSFPFGASVTPLGIVASGPAIAQTSEATAAASDTGFFLANWCYMDFANFGGGMIGTGLDAGHAIKSTVPAGAGLIWPYAVKPEAMAVNYKPYINESPDTSGATIPANSSSLTGGMIDNVTLPRVNASENRTVENTAPQAPGKSYGNMTKDDIKNTSTLERMWRNTQMGAAIPKSYKGTISSPVVIDPMDNPLDIIKPTDLKRVLKESLAMTRPGKHASAVFWDL